MCDEAAYVKFFTCDYYFLFLSYCVAAMIELLCEWLLRVTEAHTSFFFFFMCSIH